MISTYHYKNDIQSALVLRHSNAFLTKRNHLEDFALYGSVSPENIELYLNKISIYLISFLEVWNEFNATQSTTRKTYLRMR